MNSDSFTSSTNLDSYPFDELLTNSSIIFYQCYIAPRFPLQFISENVSEILRINPEEFEQDDQLWLQRIHPDDRDRFTHAFENANKNGRFSIEYRFKHGGGHYIWLYDEVKVVTDEDGTPQSLVGSSIEITDRKRAENKLRNLNEQLEDRVQQRTQDLTRINNRLKLLEMAIANINDMVIITKASKSAPLEAKIVFVNKAFTNFTGYSASEVKGKSPDFLHGPDTSEQVLAKTAGRIKNLKPLRVEFINYKRDGSSYWVELDMVPFPSEQEDEMYWVGINRNISRRKKAEQQIKESLKEKEVMLAEIHHRVKNNLAVISGLLDLQAFNEENQEVIRKLQESQSRIQSIAMVHEKLYQSDSLSSIEMNTYIDQLTDYISQVFVKENTEITIRNKAEPIALEISQAIPCGLILNELITNAYKHAFTGRDQGLVEVSVQKEGDKIQVMVRDDGVGLPEEFSLASTNSLGMTLVETLISQLEADYEIKSKGEGTTIVISFEHSG